MRTMVLIMPFLAGTSASPVNLIQTRNGSTCLAVLLTLILLLSLLVMCKQIFMKNRRTQPFAPGRSFTFDSSLRSSASALPSSVSVHSSDDGKTGFLVGLFGSPSWETRTKTLEYRDKSGWREPRDASYMYRLHTGSRRVNDSQIYNSSLTEKRTMIDVVQSQSFSVAQSTVGDIRTLYEIRDATGLDQRRSRSLRIPARPSKAYIGFPDTRTPHRSSLPAIGRKNSRINSIYRKSASSLKSPKSRYSDVSTSSSLANSSLRLVETNNRPDLPLPLSPNHRQAPTFQTLQNFTPLKANLGPKHHTSTTSSLPPRPPFSSQPDVAKKDLSKTSSALLRISHPYALIPTNPTSLESTTGMPSRSNKAFYSKVFQATSNYICPPQPVLISKTDCQSPITREPLAQATSSVNHSPLVFPSSSAGSIYSGPSPYAPLNSLNPPKVKHKPNTPPLRVRRSPAIGPSPLRSMILPDPSDTNIVTQTTSKGKEASEDSSTFGQKTHYTRLGLGFPPASYRGPMDKTDKPRETTTATEWEWNNGRRSSAQVSAQVKAEESNLLLGIIRELVEETSEWDASLFMNQNFKAMIQGSGFSPLPQETLTDSKPALNGLSLDHSEVDLGNLGIDIFRSGGETFIPPTRNPSSPGNGSVELVSFWDERGWVNPENKRSNGVGLAW